MVDEIGIWRVATLATELAALIYAEMDAANTALVPGRGLIGMDIQATRASTRCLAQWLNGRTTIVTRRLSFSLGSPPETASSISPFQLTDSAD